MISQRSYSFIFSVYLLSILFMFLSSPTPAFAVSKLINQVCEKTENYTDCVAALNIDPKAELASNLVDLAKIEFQLAIHNASYTLSYINTWLTARPTEPFKKCQTAYIAVVAFYQSSLYLVDNHVGTASYDAWMAGSLADLCESILASAGVKDERISAGNGFVKLYSIIGYWITYHEN